MNDYLVRAMTTNKEVRALAVRSTKVVNQAHQSHQTTPVATAALGRTLTAGLLMGSMFKSGDEVTLRIEGNGPLGKIIAQGNQYGQVRGYVTNPQVKLMTNQKGKLDVAKGIGQGQLFVTKNMRLKEPYHGSIPLVSGEIGDDLTYYFTKSEQTPSSVGLGVLVDKDLSVKAAGGFIIQLMPDASEETIKQLEDNLATVTSVSSLIEEGMSPEGLLEKLLTGFDFRVLANKDVEYKCKCSQERMQDLIMSLGEEELREALDKEGQVEIKCHFCGETYSFGKEGIEELLSN
ncbi:disulfide bond chaperone [Halobacteroides halobius DSM 5150]|uniref:33 kDa chaperonin n=1 Tax=Halobacteroides halobius (strain ATCC 35273 / DSM 5150 / MD-1) TaxID=748449 RepID=L0K987_HALHC|nr:Hsp33 family molecular chaperone HslO [Halobacteroides halobius]AGB41832.1 disulfide bond chaperone [Halobacteroides halobius DSM 5150]